MSSSDGVCVCVGTLTAVESFLTTSTGPEVFILIMVCVILHMVSCPNPHRVCFMSFLQGGCIHDGTWQSAVYGMADSDKLKSLRKKFNHKPLPVVGSKLKRR